jgi:hypothetical protein
LLEAPKSDGAKQLAAGAAGAKDDGHGHDKKDQSGPVGPSLTAEDLKELEDLDLSELDKDKPKAP